MLITKSDNCLNLAFNLNQQNTKHVIICSREHLELFDPVDQIALHNITLLIFNNKIAKSDNFLIGTLTHLRCLLAKNEEISEVIFIASETFPSSKLLMLTTLVSKLCSLRGLRFHVYTDKYDTRFEQIASMI